MDLDSLLNRFRIASRELFNGFFRVDAPYEHEKAWVLEERYEEVAALLFEKLVLEPGDLPYFRYGQLHPNIRAQLRHGEFAPIMLNREADSGYWDYPVKEITKEAQLSFVCFFDWDQLDYRDNRYVRVLVSEWASQPNAVGKHGLIETHYIQFLRA